MGTPTTNLRLHKPPWTVAASEVTDFSTGLDRLDLQHAHIVNVMGFWDTTAGEWKAAARDGTTDDSAVINAAIAEAVVRGCRYVYLPGGTYALDSRINLLRWVTLIGDGMNTILAPTTSFPTALSNGFGVIALGEGFNQIPALGGADIRMGVLLVKGIYIKMTDAPSHTCGIWLNNYCVCCLFEEVIIYTDNVTTKIHMGVVVDNLRYDLDGTELGATNCNGTIFRYCEFSWLAAAPGCKWWAHAAFMIRNCNDNQTIILDYCKWNKCGIPLTSMGPVTMVISPSVADLYYVATPVEKGYKLLTIDSGGRYSHFYFTKRNNIIDNGYFDSTGIYIQDHKIANIASTIVDVGVPFLKSCINIGGWNSLRYYAPMYTQSGATFTRTGDFEFTHTSNLTAYLKDGHVIDFTVDGNGGWWTISGDSTWDGSVTKVTLTDEGKALPSTITPNYLDVRAVKVVRTTGQTAKFDIAGTYSTPFAVGRYCWVGNDFDMYRGKITAVAVADGVTTVTVDKDPIPADSNIAWIEAPRQDHAVIIGGQDTAGGELIIAPQNLKIWDESYANYHHVFQMVAAGSHATYDLLYVNSSGRVAKAKANATGTLPALYIAAENAVIGQTVKCYKAGSVITNTSWSWGTKGARLYADAANAGAIVDVPPANPNYVQVVGVALWTNQIEFKPDLYYYQAPA